MENRISTTEFVVLMAMLFSIVAFSTDAMLPAFPEMAEELSPNAPNRIQFLIAAFMMGLGLGTFVVGPLADAFGRKSVVGFGAALFVLGCVICYTASNLEWLLFGRLLQGLGASGPRVGPMAIIRDLFEGRKMAQILSIITTAFMLVPAVAPYLGALIIDQFGWRAIFGVFALFAFLATLWLSLRVDETLPLEKRQKLSFARVRQAALEVVRTPSTAWATFAISMGFAQLLAIISNIQPVYDHYFGVTEQFPFYFALAALVALPGSLINASLVMRVGMRGMAMFGFASLTFMAAASWAALTYFDMPQNVAFWLWFVWSSTTFFMAGIIFGNLNALALQPLGHIAGTASSIVTGLQTVFAALLTLPVSLVFDGTPMPLMACNLISAIVGLFAVLRTRDLAVTD